MEGVIPISQNKLSFKFDLFIKLSVLHCLTQVFFVQNLSATTLSETALFYRCYYQITGSRLKLTDPLLTQVKNGSKTAVNACLQVLNLSQLTNTPNSTLINATNPIAKKVLINFHRLHYSWFSSKDFPVISWGGHNLDIKDIYDVTSPALYFTRALFKPGVPVKDVITSNDFLTTVRATSSPVQGPESGHTVADFIFTDTFSFAPKGELLGMQSAPPVVVNFPTNPIDKPYRPAGSVNLNMTLGGGLLGTQPYLLLNIGSLSSIGTYKTDGGLKVHRIWGKAVFKDLLCRDLPVVRVSDANSFVDSMSSIPFRTTNACTKCHASQDRISGVIRGMNVLYVGDGDETKMGDKKRGGNFTAFHTVTKPAESSWSSSPDAYYYQRPTNGQLYFRDYLGNLIDQPISSVSDLGFKMSDLDDFYICVAKRYYSYFIGVDIDNGDLGDPNHGSILNAAEIAHRDNVIQLGLKLKTSQNLIQLITDILNLDLYKQSDFGIRSGAHVK